MMRINPLQRQNTSTVQSPLQGGIMDKTLKSVYAAVVELESKDYMVTFLSVIKLPKGALM